MAMKRVRVTVSLWVDDSHDTEEVLENMDYTFTHEDAIKMTEIIDWSIDNEYGI